MAYRIIDLSHALSPDTPVYPGDPGVEIQVRSVARAPTASSPRTSNNSRLSLGIHNGTHMDAPFHFIPDGATIDRIPLDRCTGPATMLDLARTREPGVIDAGDLIAATRGIQPSPIVLLFTGWDRQWNAPGYFRDHAVLSEDAAAQLVRWGISAVGIDFPSVDQPPHLAHLELLGNNVLIVENLTGLDQLRGLEFEFFAIPLAIAGRDGSPVRAIARCVV
jgi:kynurenine formamidase